MISESHRKLNKAIEAAIENNQSMKHWYTSNRMLRDWIDLFKVDEIYDTEPNLKDMFEKFTYGLGHLRDLILKGSNTVYIDGK